MRTFKTFVAAGVIMLAAGTTASLARPAHAVLDEPAVKGEESKGVKREVRMLELDGALPSRSKAAGFGNTMGTTVRTVVDAFEKAKDDKDLAAVVIRLKDAQIGGGEMEELTGAIKRFRESGKKVYLYAENLSTGELMLGSACDKILAQAGGGVSLPGVFMEEMFLADMFKWVGITPDFVQIGDYKGASEMMANAKPSKAWEENINGLLDAMYANVRSDIKAGRKMDDAKLDKAMESAWLASSEQAKELGLVDEVIDFADLSDKVEKLVGGEVKWGSDLVEDPKEAMRKKMSGGPFAMLGELFGEVKYTPKRDTIAILHIDGAIIDGESEEGGLFGGGGSVGGRTIRRAIAELEENDKIKGVIVRIDSPGGSAIASEFIWQGLKRLAKTKPVWASVGGMAASGGYYIAVGTQRVYVTDSSIVGSIGVVGGKLALGGVYDKLKINVVPRARGPRASMFGSSAMPWSESDKQLVRQKMTETYELFTSRVSAGRPGIDLSKTAEGRLFVGKQGVDLKMADRLGTLHDAVHDLSEELKLSGFDVMDYPAPLSFAEAIENAFGGFGVQSPVSGAVSNQVGAAMRSEIAKMVKEVVGPSNFEMMADTMNGLMQMKKEPVILVSPRVLIVR